MKEILINNLEEIMDLKDTLKLIEDELPDDISIWGLMILMFLTKYSNIDIRLGDDSNV